MVTVLGENKPRVKNIMTLGSCAAIVGAEVGVGCGEGFECFAGFTATCGLGV
jgi:hypothetical protein